MASFTIAVASVSGSARAPRTASRAHRVAASRVPKGSLGRGSGVAARRAAAAAAATDRPVVLIDNYDSFTYNLSQVREIPEDIARRRERLKRVSERFIHHAGPGARTRTMFATLSCFTPFIESAFRQKTFRRRMTPNAADDVSSLPSHALPSSHLPHTLYSTSATSGATTSW
jgi:hypothetical protein